MSAAAHPAGPPVTQLRPGAVVRVDGCASVQFGGGRALTLRLTGLPDLITYAGWLWLAGYVLGADGSALARREVFVQPGGLHLLRAAPATVQARRVSARV